MKIVIDTSSLTSLVRYYLRFDKNSILVNFIKTKIINGEIIIIDKVLDECKLVSKGIILEKLDFLADKDFLKSVPLPYKTDKVLANKKLMNQLDNSFVVSLIKKQLDDVEFENRKNAFLESADLKQIILCQNLNNEGEDMVLVTEETINDNDNKLFKKIPFICKELKIKTMTLPEVLEIYEDIFLNFQSTIPENES
ncbi:MAG: DUF4411 family protein [Ignavibacteria bacterium]|nr:DUF4411 family protein [Ignavibacteria bacterium]